MYTYEYTDDTPRDFPTLGKRDVKKGDKVESEAPLSSQYLKEIKPVPQPKENEK